MMKLAINNSIYDSTGLSPVYTICKTPKRIRMDMIDGSRVVFLAL